MNYNGSTKRERDINDFKSNVQKIGVDSISCKKVNINGYLGYLFINSTEDPYTKTFQDMYDIVPSPGCLIYWANNYWLVDSMDSDDEVYADGKLKQCNYVLNFLNASGIAVSKNCYIENYTKYNAGVKTTGNQTQMELGVTQYFIKLPLDTDTQCLDRLYSDGSEQRIIIDKYTSSPKTYKITLADRVSYPGIIALTVSECQGSVDDNLELLIADYYSRVASDSQSSTPSSGGSCIIIYSGDPILKYGQGYKTFAAKFLDSSGSEVTNTSLWELTMTNSALLTYVNTQFDGNDIKIKVTDDSLIGSTIKLKLSDTGSTVSSSIDIEVRSLV